MTAQIHHFPSTALITGDRDGQLTAALEISHRVFSGEPVSLQAMWTAREVIDSRTQAKATVALLTTYIDARREAIRTEARAHEHRGTIRAALLDAAILAGFGAVVFVVIMNMGGSL
jgi:hypothetical protein